MNKIVSFLIKIIQKNKFLGKLAEDLYSSVPRLFMSGRAFAPINVLLLLTYRCNLRCKMCYYYNESEKSNTLSLIEKRKSEELTLEQIKKLIDEISAMGVKVLTLHGGEPLVHKDLFAISKYAYSKGLLVNFFTNGILLDEATIEKIIDARINAITISMDGPERIHDNVRGLQGAFAKIINGIAIFKKKEKEGLPIPKLSLVTSVSALNEDSVVELFGTIRSTGVKQWSIALVTNDSNKLSESTKKMLGLSSANVQGDLSGLSEDIINLDTKKMFRIRDELKKEKADADIQIDFPTERFINNFADPSFNESDNCLAPWARAVISPYGEVNPCIMLSMIDANMGNIKEKSFREIWNGGKFIEFRKTLKKNGTLPICSKCCFINDKQIL
jgi:radical SAM protein with 4Fe4S-binding SPASM domain